MGADADATPRAASAWGINSANMFESFFDTLEETVRTSSHVTVQVSRAVPRDIAETPEEVYELVLKVRARLPADSVYAMWGNDGTSNASLCVSNPKDAPSKAMLDKKDAVLLSKGNYTPKDKLYGEMWELRKIICGLCSCAYVTSIFWVPSIFVVATYVAEMVSAPCARALSCTALETAPISMHAIDLVTLNATALNTTATTLHCPAEGFCFWGPFLFFLLIAACVIGDAVLAVLRMHERENRLQEDIDRIEKADSPECVAWCASVLGEHQKRNV